MRERELEDGHHGPRSLAKQPQWLGGLISLPVQFHASPGRTCAPDLPRDVQPVRPPLHNDSVCILILLWKPNVHQDITSSLSFV